MTDPDARRTDLAESNEQSRTRLAEARIANLEVALLTNRQVKLRTIADEVLCTGTLAQW